MRSTQQVKFPVIPASDTLGQREIEQRDSSSADGQPSEPVAAAKLAAGRDEEKRTRPGAEHAVTRDYAAYKAHPTAIDFLRHAQQRSGRHPLEMVGEYFRLSRGRGKLSLAEYVQYGVYDTARFTPEDQTRFISTDLHWRIASVCCDMSWRATTEDKWLCSHILDRTGIRIPQTLAVIDKSDRTYPNTHKISTAEQLRDFMTSEGVLPLFAKENRGVCSLGAFLVLSADKAAMVLKREGPMSYETCLNQFIGTTPYLLQRLERNHPFFHRYTDSLATVRVCILICDDGVKIPFAILKLPSRNNVADNFWRPGNLACTLDLETGRILRARSRNKLGTTDYAVHPETSDPLVGEILPKWDRVLELARACSAIFYPVRFQSMDIAITESGPVLIEINTGCGFDLPQLASGEGLLTDEMCAFFRSRGYKRL